ncbi:MAG: sensor histidine kinase [Pararhodobacter sp.]|nr:sensor histidine kinase [Pararhodobacter sp.]
MREITPHTTAIPGTPARRRGVWAALALLGLVLALTLGQLGYERARNAALGELAQRGENTLHLAVAALRGQLRRFDRLPALIAQQAVIHALLRSPGNPDVIDAANQYLRDTDWLLDSSDVYLMALDGNTLAASNFDTDISFVGGNFAFRPYFRDALSHGAGRFYALGTTSLVRGYYFGAPIEVDGETAGVLVFKVDLDSIEEGWRGSNYEVIVTDPEGIIFMSSHPDWTFGATLPLTPERIARTEATRRYANAPVHPLPLTIHSGPGDTRLWRIGSDEGEAGEYIIRSVSMPDADWTVHVLVSTDGARLQALTLVAVAGLLAGLAGLGAVIVVQRRTQLRERLALQAAAQAQLEQRVRERTKELATVNRQLEAEVTERRATEARLRATQDELVQAGKLAALGQMSAALSHEFNQPLGAARNFAENAQLLIERGRIDEANTNIGRIVGLVEKMSRISKHLRNFARKPNVKLSAVPLHDALTAAIEIVGWRLTESGVTLINDLGETPIHVRAGHVRLQQVLVNILSNAIDALDGQPQRQIRLSVRTDNGHAVLSITDTGPGIAASLVERIFDPFFSTKGVGKGLGLGLSISYNIVHDFGGTLAATNAPDGGAVFTLTLPLAQPDQQEAA